MTPCSFSSDTYEINIFDSLFYTSVESFLKGYNSSLALMVSDACFLTELSAQSLKSESDFDLFFRGFPFDGDGIKL